MRQQPFNKRFITIEVLLNTYLPRILAMTVGIVFLLIAATQTLTIDLTGERLVILTTFVIIFVCVDLLAGRIENGLWAGYLNLVVMTIWLSVGLLSALALVLLGSMISTFLRLRGNLFIGMIPLPRKITIALLFKRITLCGMTLLGASAVFYLAGGSVPVTDMSFSFIPTLLALSTSLLLTQLLGVLMSDCIPKPPTIWAKGQQGRVMNEILLLITIPALSVVYHSQGVVIFVLLMGLVAAQALRHWQIHRTQKSLLNRVEELSLLNETAQSLSSSLNLSEVLAEIYATLCKYSNIPVFLVAQYHETQASFDFPLVIINGQKQKWLSEPIHQTPALAYVIEKNKPLHITYPDSVHTLGHLYLPNEYHAFLGLPLCVGDKMLGVLGIADVQHIRLLERLNPSTLNTMTNQMGLAIRNTALYARTTKVALALAEINQMTQTVALAPEQDEALKEACMTAIKIANADRVAIFLHQINTQTLRLAWHIGLSEDLVALYQTPAYQSVVETFDEPILVHDAHHPETTQADALLADIGDFRAMAKLPLKSSQNLLGILVVYHNQPHHYHAVEVDLLQTLANQLAVAYDNSELLRALELYGWEQSQLVYLSDISTSTLDVETIIINVTRLLQYATETDWSDIILAPNNQKEAMQFSINPILAPKDVSHIAEFIGLFNQKATHVTVFRQSALQTTAPLKDFMSQYMLRVMHAVPLITNNRVIGVLLLGNQQDKSLTENQARLCEMAAKQIATQIQNALVHQRAQYQLKRRIKELSLIETIAQQISGALDKEQLIRNVLQSAIHASGAELAALALVTPHQTLRIIHIEAQDDGWHDYEIETALHVGLVGKVLNNCTPIIIANNLRESAYTQPYLEASSDNRAYMSSALVPLMQEGVAIGVLNVESSTLDFFNNDHLEFFKNLAGHAVISIQNATLLKERQARIEQISASNNQLQAILNSTRDGVIFLDSDGVLVKSNRSAEEMLNLPLNRYEGADFITYVWAEYALDNSQDNLSLAQALQEITHILQSEPAMLTTTPFEIQRKDGQAHYIRVVGSPVRDSQETIIGRLLTLHDITEERMLAKYRQNITRMMVHDLRGPLSSVISGVSFATSLIDPQTDPTLTEVMTIAYNNAQNLLELVESLLDIYKLQAGQMILNIVEADLAQIVHSAHSALASTMQEADIRFRMHIDPLLPHVHVDANILRRILINLLDNAVRFSPAGGEVWLMAMHMGNKLEIRIADSGNGIPISEQERIFDEFHQVKDNVPQRGSKGSGLGLTFCKLAIEAHGGTIAIASQSPLSGACFVLTLPVLKNELETQTAVITASVKV